MPLRRSAATKVMVFQCPCGTRPISLSPRGQRPLSRTILVLAAVSSTKTRWAGSNMPCSRIQRWRARATSARSCSAARRLFFESDVVTLEEAPHRAAAARNLVPVHRQNRLVQGQVWPSRNQTQQKICMLLQRRDASAPRLSRTAARLPKALDPNNRRAGTDIKLLGRRAPRRPAFNFRNHLRPHVFRIGLRHRPASQNRINADRLSHPSPSENLLDSIGTEHALACGCLIGVLGFGPRSGMGFFLTPMSSAHGWGRDLFALALAIQMLLWGAAQPFAGAVADRFGAAPVLSAGAVHYALGLAAMAYAGTPAMLHLSAGVMIGFGLAGSSFTVVIGAFGKLMPLQWRSLAFGAGTAAGSFGQFLFSPLAVALIDGYGWQHTLVVFAAIVLLIMPLSLALAAPRQAGAPAAASNREQ